MKGNILIVDDDQVVGNILERFLSTDDAVTRAIDGREALALFQNEPPFDLLLVDLKMPRMGGHEL
jgi:CheY-like chemotaxis protein